MNVCTVSWSYTCEYNVQVGEVDLLIEHSVLSGVGRQWFLLPHFTCVHPRLSYFQRHLKIVKLLKKLRCVWYVISPPLNRIKNVWSLFELLYQLLKNSEGDKFLISSLEILLLTQLLAGARRTCWDRIVDCVKKKSKGNITKISGILNLKLKTLKVKLSYELNLKETQI